VIVWRSKAKVKGKKHAIIIYGCFSCWECMISYKEPKQRKYSHLGRISVFGWEEVTEEGGVQITVMFFVLRMVEKLEKNTNTRKQPNATHFCIWVHCMIETHEELWRGAKPSLRCVVALRTAINGRLFYQYECIRQTKCYKSNTINPESNISAGEKPPSQASRPPSLFGSENHGQQS